MASQQHFLLSAKARTLSVRQVFELSEQEAFKMFKEVRWGAGKEQICPSCGVVDKHYYIGTRKQWRCKACNHTFSITSGTIFAHHKLPLKVYLAAIALFTNAVKGISALQLGRDLGVQYKTAFILAHKIRQSLIDKRDDSTQMTGEVHVDGAYFNHHVRPKNMKSERVDRRLAKNQKSEQRCVMVFRQLASAVNATLDSPTAGSNRTLTFVVKSENATDVKALASKFLSSEVVIHADESPAYNILHSKYNTKRVEHKTMYQTKEGINTNQAESYFARLRRMQYGQTHHFGNEYLANYANEIAYREDTRRWANGKIFTDILTKCLKTETHRDWCGYWQGNKTAVERLVC